MVFPAASANLSPQQNPSHTLDQPVRLPWCAVHDLYTAFQLWEWYGFIQHHSSLPVLLYSLPNNFHQSIFLLITASHRSGIFPDWTAFFIIWLISSADCLSICLCHSAVHRCTHVSIVTLLLDCSLELYLNKMLIFLDQYLLKTTHSRHSITS